MTILGCAFVTLLILKIANVVTWSWWIITAPVWAIPALILIGELAVIACCSWDRYLSFIPRPRLFWFDRDGYAPWKILIAVVALSLIFVHRAS